MRYYLLKTEPSEYSYDDLIKEGKTIWDGVKNKFALKFIKQMEIDDLAFIYHTGKEKQIVGLAKVVSKPYLDKNDLPVVDVEPVRKFNKPLKLSEIKKIDDFKDFYLVKMPRLSVMEVPENLANKIFSLVD